MSYAEVNQNACTGTGLCIENYPTAFEWDPQNPGKARRVAGSTCDNITQGSCQPAIDLCPENAIYHVD